MFRDRDCGNFETGLNPLGVVYFVGGFHLAFCTAVQLELG